MRGMERKIMTGDGRKSTPTEKFIKDMNKTAKEAEEMFLGKQKKTTKKKKK